MERGRGEETAKEYKAQFAEVSAYSGVGVDKVSSVGVEQYVLSTLSYLNGGRLNLS